MMKKYNYLIISGGTGGHVIPAVNFGNFIIQQGHNCYFFVDKRGKKYASSFEGKIIEISSSHFSSNFFGKIKATKSLLFGFFQSLKYLIKIRPSFCISFGSYATFMPLTALFFLSFFRFLSFTKIYLHEQNSVMGKVNIFFTPFVNKIFLNFEETKKLKDKYKIKSFLVGLPKNHKFNYRLRKTDLDNKIVKKIFICGGSQGAVNLNIKIIELFNKMPRDILDRIEVSMQCPKSQFNEIKKSFEKMKILYDLKDFYENFTDKLHTMDILIARAGAGTVNDVIITQTPTIFVPLPSAASEHQTYNANYLINKKAALLFEEKNLDQNQSLITLVKFIKNSNKQVNIIKSLQKIKSFDSNKLIYDYLNDKKK